MDALKNIFTIRTTKNLVQQDLANALGMTISNYSKLESGKREVKLSELSIIANKLEMKVIDILTYPDVYVKKDGSIEPIVTNEENPYKLLYELQKENGELRVEIERLKNESAIGRNAIAG